MSLKIKLKKGISCKTECHWNGMSLKMKGHSKWCVNKNGVSLKTESNWKLNVT